MTKLAWAVVVSGLLALALALLYPHPRDCMNIIDGPRAELLCR